MFKGVLASHIGQFWGVSGGGEFWCELRGVLKSFEKEMGV